MIEFNNLTKAPISQSFIKKVIQDALKKIRVCFEQSPILFLKSAGRSRRIREAEISVVLVDKKTIRRLNKRWRGIDQVTDVLSFNYSSTSNNQFPIPNNKLPISIVGEIIICYPQAKEQAIKQKHSIKKEIEFLLVHGLLHLAGYNHENMKKMNHEL